MFDLDLDRFGAGWDVARSLHSSISSRRGPYSDVFVQQILRHGVTGRTAVRNAVVRPIHLKSKARVTEGVAFRRLGNPTVFVSGNGLAPDSISDLAKCVGESSQTYLSVSPTHESLTIPAPVQDVLTTLTRETCDAVLSLFEDSFALEIQATTLRERRALANSSGFDGPSEQVRTELHVEIETDRGKVNGTWIDWGTNPLSSIDPYAVGEELHRRSRRHPETVLRLPESVAILFPPGWGGSWMHEAVGHLLEADTALSGRSPLYDRRADRIAEDFVEISDDGAFEPSRVPASHDDEGTAMERTTLIRNGKVVGLLTDRDTAERYGLPLTGNGRRAHFGMPPRPRMTNLLLGQGPSSRDDLLRMNETVVVVDRISHAWLDVNDQRLHIIVEEAALAKNGERMHDLGRVMVSADPIELLANVAGVGDDFAVDLNHGYCAKDGAAVPVTIGQPSVLINSMQIQPAPQA